MADDDEFLVYVNDIILEMYLTVKVITVYIVDAYEPEMRWNV